VLPVAAFVLMTGIASWTSVWISHQGWVRNALLITGPWLLLLMLSELRNSARAVRRRFRHRPFPRRGKRPADS
jgi:hypothetical protein